MTSSPKERPKIPNEARAMLKQVQELFLSDPAAVIMTAWWLDRKEIKARRMVVPKCRSVGCIAGWIVAMNGDPDYDNDHDELAIQLLGLKRQQTDRLFYSWLWPVDLKKRLFAANEQSPEYAQVVVDRIERFLVSGGKR